MARAFILPSAPETAPPSAAAALAVVRPVPWTVDDPARAPSPPLSSLTSPSSSSSLIVSCLASTQSITRPIVMRLAIPSVVSCSVDSPCWIIWRTSDRQAE